MKRDFLEGLGLEKDTVDKIMAENGADLEREKASKAVGVPHENVVNLFNASCRQVCVKAMGQFRGEYAYLRLTADPETESGKYFDLLFQTKKTDRKAYEAILADMVERDLFATDSKTTEERIHSAMRARLEKTNAFVEREDEILPAVTPGLAGLEGGAARYAEEATKDYARVKALEALDPDYSRPDTYAWIEKADKGAGVGLDTAEYILFKTALKMAGEDGSLKQEEVIDVLEEMDLSDAERGYLFGTKYTSGKNNSWG